MTNVDTTKVRLVGVIVGLPDGMYVEYCGKLFDGRSFCIYRPEGDWSYEDFRLLLGSETRMTPVAIQNVTRYRDGGTTEIKTEIGEFHFPTPFKPEEKPTFCGDPVTLMGRHVM